MTEAAPSVFIYGAGRVATAVTRLAAERGVRVVGAWSRGGSSAGRWTPGVELAAGPEPPPTAADVWLLAVSDDAVEPVATLLAAAVRAADGAPRPRVAAHCAGGLPAAALAPLAALGIPCGGWHPAMTFRGGPDDAGGLSEAWVAVEGEGPAGRALEALARALGLPSVRVAADRKARYHAALVLASNGRVALDAAARRLLEEAGIEAETAGELLAPLVARTDANLAGGGPGEALTGPVARGDARTVRVQVEALADRPALLALYRAIGAVLLELVPPGARTEGHAEVARLVE